MNYLLSAVAIGQGSGGGSSKFEGDGDEQFGVKGALPP